MAMKKRTRISGFVHIPEGKYCGTKTLSILAGTSQKNIRDRIITGAIKSVRLSSHFAIIPESSAFAYVALQEKKHGERP